MRRRCFTRWWFGTFVGDLGGRLSGFALPCIAVVALHAGPLAAGALQALEFAVVPVFALPAGAFVTRFTPRRVMIVANIARSCALASIPLAIALHRLGLAQCFVVGAVVGAASACADTASAAWLPIIVGRAAYARATGRVAVGASFAEALGSGISGAVVQALGAASAVGINVVAYAVATVNLVRMRRIDPCLRRTPASAYARSGTLLDTWREIARGFRLVSGDAVLRRSACITATSYFGGAMVMSVFLVRAYGQLHVSAAALGFLLAIANAGMIGAALTDRACRRFGRARTLQVALVVAAGGEAAFLLHGAPLAGIVVARCLLTLTGPIIETTQAAIRLTRVGDGEIAAMTATIRAIGWSALPFGALAGGALGAWAGTGAPIALGAAFGLAAAALACRPPAQPGLDAVRRDRPRGDRPARERSCGAGRREWQQRRALQTRRADDARRTYASARHVAIDDVQREGVRRSSFDVSRRSR